MLALINNRRCGSETIESVLRSSFGWHHCPLRVNTSRRVDPVITSEEVERTLKIYPRIDSLSGHGVVPWSDLVTAYPQLRFFAFLRSPLERCASEYQDLVTQRGLRKTFESWIQSPTARNHQVRRLCGVEDADTAIRMVQTRLGFVGLMERFNESLVMFRRWANDERVDIRYHARNTTRDSRIRVQLLRNLQTRRQLLDANREDLRLHAFIENVVYPQQVADYGNRLETDVEAFEAFNVPAPVFSRMLPRVLLHHCVQRPLNRWLMLRTNPSASPLPPPMVAASPDETPLRRAA